MSDIITGQGLNLQYNTDTGNRSPQGVGNITINEVNTFPVLKINSESTNYDTYDSEYKTVLLSDGSVDPFQIVVNYLPDDPTHQFLDDAAEKQTLFQMIIQYELNMDESTITYAIVNGYITSTMIGGDKDEVVTRSYTFQAETVAARMMTAAALLPIYQGDYGVGSNTTDVPQYAPVTPTGNSFIKVPSTQAGNPVGADMMGVGLVDAGSVVEFAITKTGTLSLFAKNATTAWTRIYTATQMDSRYVPLTRTINGKELSGNIVLSSTDTGSLAIANNLSDVANVETSKQNLGIDRITQTTSFSQLHNPKTDGSIGRGTHAITISTDGTWGARVASDGTWKPLAIAQGGTGATTAANARINLAVDRLVETSASTNLNYPTKNAALVLRDSDGVWGVYDNTAAQWSALGIGQGGTGAVTAGAARTNLGLGTAAIVNTGTSGATVPLLSTNNTWSGLNKFDSAQTTFSGASTSTGNGIEIGSLTTASLSYVDLHSSGTGNDYDVRLQVSGGSSTVGQGGLTINAASVTMPNLALTTDLAIAHGGTGASDIDSALTNLNAMKFQRSTLGASDNLNDFNGNNPGFYYCASNVNATAANNYPVTQAGSLMVMRNGANGAFGCTQIYSPYNSNDIYVRTGFAGTTNTWSGWNIILQQGSFGVGAIATPRPADATNSFIADADGATTWAAANGAGFQSSYANNRLFQFIMTTANNAYIRYNSTGDPQSPKTTTPWTKLLTPGDYGIGADLTVNASTPISNLNETTPTGFYYTTNESTLGGVTSDTTYTIVNRGGRPTATASKYVQQRSWDGFYMGTNGWTWKENAYMSALNQGQFRVQANGEAIRMVSTSGQACYIMGMLSDTTDVTQRRWYFGNGGSDNTVVMYNSRTNNSMGLAAAGNVYIQARSDSTGSGTAYTTQFQSNGTIVGPLGTVTQTSSDIRLKSNVIEAKEGALERINNIGCVEFTWDNEERRDRGFIAQQLAEIDELYTYKPNEDGYLNYSSTALMSDTFGAIQELTRIKDNQARRIETLESTVQNQQVQIDELKALVQSLIDNK
ncbi:pyocin knob domain-containing S74 family peptidase [Enterobacter cloacae]|uniref:tail fiber domain-containing protein n=1 Tax=Enterobacter cloacae TaxID=550 RepID=UPI0034D49D47